MVKTVQNLQIRLPDEELADIDGLTTVLHMSKSEVARNALHEGLKVMKMGIAIQRYLNEEYTLCKAAEFANVSLIELARYATERGIPFFRYSENDLDDDIKRADKWFE